MRPLLVEIEGFGAFREPVTIDFDDTSFFALVGPTGAGKSTVIDAICFALYGNVPRYDDLRVVAPVISTGALEAKVRLTFELAGMVYVAVRVVRRSGARVTTKEARLERLGHDPAVLAGTTTELTPAVESLIGLTFEHFTRCVVLPQGEFARFLHDKPADRQELLVRLLDLGVYEQMAQLANRQAKDNEVAADLVHHQLSTLVAHDDAALTSAEARASELQSLAAKLAEAQVEMTMLDAAAAAAHRERQEAQEVARALAAVEVPAEVLRHGELLARAQTEVSAAEAAHAQAEQALAVALTRAEAGGDVAAFDGLVKLHERIERGVAKQHEAHHALDVASGEADAAQLAVASAQQDVELARAAFDARRDQHSASALRAHLTDGGVCLVCEQVVAHVPRGTEPPVSLVDAEAAWKRAESALDRERRVAARAGEAVAGAQANLSNVERLLAELREQVAGAPSPEDSRAQLAVATEAHDALAHARRAEQQARAAVAPTRAALGDIQARLGTVERIYHQQRDPLVALGAPAPSTDLLASWAALVAWVAGVEPQQESRRHAAAAAVDQIARDRSALVASMRSSMTEAGVAVGDHDLAALAVVVARAEADAAHTVRSIREAQLQAGQLATRAAAHRDQAAVARALAQLLSARGFPRWLVAEAMVALVGRASITLDSLTAGQYSLAADDGGEISVVDHRAADERRSVRTLSGGETFQASLALALALADELGGRASGAGAPLEAIFLDEGFGTLDAESLDTVAATIESLGDSGRMVGIVTHLPALAERVPVRYVVSKGPRTSTVRRELG